LVFVMMGLTIYEKEQCIRPVPESGLHGKQSRVPAIAASTKFKELASNGTKNMGKHGLHSSGFQVGIGLLREMLDLSGVDRLDIKRGQL